MKRKENMGLKGTWQHIRRSPYQAFAAVFIITQTFFVGSIFTFLIVGSAQVIDYFESLPQVTAFFKNEAKQEDIDMLGEKLKATGTVDKLEFVSKQEALKIFQKQNKDDPLLLELVTSDVLPASFEITTNRIDDLKTVSDILLPYKETIIDTVIYPKDLISNLTAWTNALRQIGVILISVLALDSLFIMGIILSIKISHKKEEIGILRLLGAGSWYVRGPFIVEGIIYGVTGAIIGWAVATLVLWGATPFLQSVLGHIPLFPVSPVFLVELLGIEIFLAVILGAFSSFLAVLRYLK